jgi:hypothetical protein
MDKGDVTGRRDAKDDVSYRMKLPAVETVKAVLQCQAPQDSLFSVSAMVTGRLLFVI